MPVKIQRLYRGDRQGADDRLVKTDDDWKLIEPYLTENERQFGITIEELLSVNGIRRQPQEVYRKVEVKGNNTLLKETENR